MADVGEAFVRIAPDTSGFRAELDADLKAATAGVSGTVHISLDQGAAQAVLTDLAGQLERFAKSGATSSLSANTEGAQAALAAINAELYQWSKTPNTALLGASTQSAQGALAAINTELANYSSGESTAKVGVNTAGADAALGQLQTELSAVGNETVSPEVNVASFGTAQVAADLLDQKLSDLSYQASHVKLNLDDSDAEARLNKALTALTSIGNKRETLNLDDTDAENKIGNMLAGLEQVQSILNEVGNDQFSFGATGLTNSGASVAEISAQQAAYGAMYDSMDAGAQRAADDNALLAEHIGNVDAALQTVATDGVRTYGALGAAIAASGLTAITSGATLALHSMIETLALAVPAAGAATVAIAGMGLAAIPAADSIYQRMTSVYDVYSATGQLIPQISQSMGGLTTAMNPYVVQAFGDALDVVNRQGGAFDQFILGAADATDRFFARLVVDTSTGSGGFMHFLQQGDTILHDMLPVLENLGASFENFIKAAEQTHIAEDLLNYVLNPATALLRVMSSLPTPILSVAIALHAIETYGGAALGPVAVLAASLGGVDNQLKSLPADAGKLSEFGAAFGTIGAGIENIVSKIPLIGPILTGTGSAAETAAGDLSKLGDNVSVAGDGMVTLGSGLVVSSKAAEDLGAAAEDAAGKVGLLEGAMAFFTSPAGIALGVAAAAGTFAYLAVTVLNTKDATQQWIDSLNKTVQAATPLTVVNTTLKGVSQTTDKLTAAQQQLYAAQHQGAEGAGELNLQFGSLGQVLGDVTRFFGGPSQAVDNLKSKISQLTAEQQKLEGESDTASGHLALLAGSYGLTAQQAEEFASQAGVTGKELESTGKDWQIAQQQVAGLVEGYRALGPQAGLLGQNLNAVSFSTSEQQSKVTTLNQAWDTFLSTVSGGETSFVSWEQGLQTLATNAAASGASMDGLNSQSLTLRSSFESQITSSGQLNDQYRIMAQAAGLTGGQTNLLTKATEDQIIALAPYARGSQQATAQLWALAQQGGLTYAQFQNLTSGAYSSATAQNQLNSITGSLTKSTSTLATDMQNLAQSINSQLNAAMAKTTLTASGANGAMATYTNTIMNHTSTVAAGRAARQQLITDLEGAGYSAGQAQSYIDSLTANALQGMANQLTSYSSPTLRTFASNLDVTAQQAGWSKQQTDNFITSLKGVPANVKAQIEAYANGSWTVAPDANAQSWFSKVQSEGLAKGLGLAAGGQVPGPDRGYDTVPAMLRGGEYVLTPEATSAIGVSNLDAFNAMAQHFVVGGYVGATGLYNTSPTGLGSFVGNEDYNQEGEVEGTTAEETVNAIKGIGEAATNLLDTIATKSQAQAAAAAAAGGGAAPSAATSAAEGSVAAAVYNYFKSVLSPAAIAGLIGNMYGESSLNPEAVGSGGGGLIGFTPLPGGYVTGNYTADLQTQLQAVWNYIVANGGFAPINAAATGGASSAALEFMNSYERPAAWAAAESGPTRAAVAEQYLAAGYEAGGPIPGGPGTAVPIIAHGGEYVLNKQDVSDLKAALVGGASARSGPAVVMNGTVIQDAVTAQQMSNQLEFLTRAGRL